MKVATPEFRPKIGTSAYASMRLPTVKALIVVWSKLLTRRWMNTLPREMTACWMMAGTPNRSEMPNFSRSKTNSPFLKRKIGYFINMYATLTAAEAAWAMTVATATPTTPQPKLTTNQTSRMVFRTALTIRKYIVARLSPMARSIPATAL